MRTQFWKLCALLVMTGLVLSGCRSCVRESTVWQHTFRTPAQKACPTVRPEYELPPGGPYMEKPAARGTSVVKTTVPEKTGGEITVKSR